MKSRKELPFVLITILLTMHFYQAGAQQVCTFSGRDINTGLEVKIDDINIQNLTQNKDTTIFTTSFRFDWPVASGISGMPLIPDNFFLSPNYPNSFTAATLFSVMLPKFGQLRLTLHNLLGQQVAALEKTLQPGFHEFAFKSGRLPQGIYFLTASSNHSTSQIKLIKVQATEMGTPELVYRGMNATTYAPLTKSTLANTYTFTGYAKGYLPCTLANIVPIHGKQYNFDFVPFTTLGISSGGFTEAGSQDISAAGGTLRINRPGCPINGMTITVPPASYSNTKAFSVLWAPVLDCGLGEDFTPVSPLIRIANGGGSADSVMIVKIPINLERDQFAMAFFYDEITNELEALPILALTDAAIQVATRHFSDGEQSLLKTMTPKKDINLIVGAVRIGRLSGDISTDFKPGVDDWEFNNYGSYIASSGHCAGQSVAMMWYFTARKPRLGQLFNHYDQVHTPTMWMDNPLGYRLCSVIQKDRNFDNLVDWLIRFEAAATGKFSADSLHYLSFAYAMKMNRQPQYVSVSSESAGHAIVAYSIKGGKIQVCDPNYPGEARTIDFSGGEFAPYQSKQNAQGQSRSYPKIQFWAKTAMISYAGMEKRWSEFEAGSIGTVPPNLFPETVIYYLRDGEKVPLPDEMTIMADSVEMFAECPTCEIKYPTDRTPLTILQENGTILTRVTDVVKGALIFKPFSGTWRYGFYVSGFANYMSASYIDFRWVTITRLPLLFIEPEKPAALVSQELTFTARSNGTAPSPCTWVWDFSDGTGEVRVTNDSTVKHTYKMEGLFAVKVRLLDKNGTEVARATVTASIGNPLVGQWAFDVTVTDDICDLTFDREVFPMNCTVENNKLCFSIFDLPPNCFNYTIENNQFSWWGTSVDEEGLTTTITANGTIVDQDHWHGTGNEAKQVKGENGDIKICTYNTIFTAVRR